MTDGRVEHSAPPAFLRDVWPAAWPGLLLALVLLVPFLAKAHTIDDVTFLLEAQHVLTDPLHPTAFEMVADGNRIRLSSQLVSGPVMAWLLTPTVLLGGAEWMAHLTQLVLVLVAILATVSLGLGFGLGRGAARFAGLLLAATPAAMVLATTAMADVPAMALGVVGIERLRRFRAEGRLAQAVAGALALALAALARSHLLLLLPIVAFALPPAESADAAEPSDDAEGKGPAGESDARDRTGARGGLAAALVHGPWLPAAAAFVAIWFVNRLTADPTRAAGSLVDTMVARFRPVAVARNLAALAIHFVLVIPLALPWVVARWRGMRRSPLLWVIALCGVAWIVAGVHLPVRRGLAPLALLGVLAIADVIGDAVRRRDRIQLLLGAWLLIAVPTVAYVHSPSKYLVPSAPAVALLVARLRRRADGALPAAAAWAAVVVGAALGLAIATADAEFANVGRRVASEWIAPRVRAGERVWYRGGWGSEWYALAAGARPLAHQPPFPAGGDVVVASAATPGGPLATASLDSLDRLTVRSRFGRIMVRARDAGFYSNVWGVLPWTWKNGPIEEVTAWRVPAAANRAGADRVRKLPVDFPSRGDRPSLSP